MNKFYFALGLFAMASMSVRAQYMKNIYKYIEDLSVYEENQEEGHAYYLADSHVSLNGKWKFFFADTPEGVPAEFFKPGFNDARWR